MSTTGQYLNRSRSSGSAMALLVIAMTLAGLTFVGLLTGIIEWTFAVLAVSVALTTTTITLFIHESNLVARIATASFIGVAIPMLVGVGVAGSVPITITELGLLAVMACLTAITAVCNTSRAHELIAKALATIDHAPPTYNVMSSRSSGRIVVIE